MRLNRTQRRTARIFDREADRFGASPMEREALYEAGLVEANLMNPASGHSTSIGSLQEQAHYGSVRRRLNRGKAARRFLTEARQVRRRGFKGSSGQLAQAVQRSAFPDRYEAQDATAEAILKRFEGRRSSNGRGGKRSASTSVGTPGIDRSADRMALAASYFQERGRPGALVRLAEGLEAAQDVPAQPAPGRPGEALPGGEGRRSKRSPGLVRGTGPVIGEPHSGTHTLGNWQSDRARDIGVRRGTPVYTPASGRVVKVKVAPEGGRISGSSITVRKADGTNEYFFTHLSDVNVRVGQRVKKGQQIGKSGVAVGVPHLHFGQKRGNVRKRKI